MFAKAWQAHKFEASLLGQLKNYVSKQSFASQSSITDWSPSSHSVPLSESLHILWQLRACATVSCSLVNME